MGFKDDLAAAKTAVQSEEPGKSPVIEVAVNEKLYELVFYRASTADWSLAAMKNLPRPGVALDLKNGYDLSGAAREISAKYGRVIESDAEATLDAEEWADLWEVISPSSARAIEASVWYLHEHDAEQEILRAKKASKPRPASRKKSS